MKTLTITSPTIHKFANDEIIGEVGHRMYTQEKMGVNIPIYYSVIAIAKEGQKIDLDFNVITMNDEPIGIIGSIQQVVASCAQLGERLFEHLISINTRLKSIPELSALYEPYEEKFKKMDFSKHRDLFSDLIKSGKLKWLDELMAAYHIKSVTKTFAQFIKDRNKYTHGHLLYWYDKKLTLLRYRNDALQTEYGILNSEILNAYIQVYIELDEILGQIANKLQGQ